MKRLLAILALTIAAFSLTTPAQAHDQADWYPWKWNQDEVGTSIK